MLPLVAIATSILPDLIKIIAGDKAGTVATDVANAVKTITGETDPTAAKAKIAADPAIATNLQVQLAQIALTAAKQQNDEADAQRQTQLAELQQRLADVQNARTNLLNLATSKSPIAWVAPTVSFLVMIGFYVLLTILIINHSKDDNSLSKDQLINICIGALVAAFSTVVNFWIGSSKGSQDKDQVQAAQTTAVLKTQAEQTAVAFNTANAATEKAAAATAAVAQRGAGAPATDSSSNFNQCLVVVFGQEGGYTNDPNDPGGPTNFGITLADLKEWRNDQNLTADDVKNMTKAEAQEIYRSKYWNPMQCGDLPNGVDLEVFDFGVNAGVRTAVKTLQAVVGVTADGSIGPITLAATKAGDPQVIIQNFSTRRLDYYRSLPGWEHFGVGWTNRTNAVEQAALKMVGDNPPVA
jgi:hypothetical protein